jgi:hypothetical protein
MTLDHVGRAEVPHRCLPGPQSGSVSEKLAPATFAGAVPALRTGADERVLVSIDDVEGVRMGVTLWLTQLVAQRQSKTRTHPPTRMAQHYQRAR